LTARSSHAAQAAVLASAIEATIWRAIQARDDAIRLTSAKSCDQARPPFASFVDRLGVATSRTLLIAVRGLIARWGGLVLVLGSRRLLVHFVRHVMTDDAAADGASDAVVNHMARYAADHRPLQTAFGLGRNGRKQGRERKSERCAGEDSGLHRYGLHAGIILLNSKALGKFRWSDERELMAIRYCDMARLRSIVSARSHSAMPSTTRLLHIRKYPNAMWAAALPGRNLIALPRSASAERSRAVRSSDK
jgi:hypothetical protein